MNTSYNKTNTAPQIITPTLVVINGGAATKQIKYNKDGSIKKTKCNKKSGVSSEVFAFRTREQIASVVNVLDAKIANAPDKNKLQIAHRNKLLFVLGINLGLRASDLRTLKWSFFFDTDGEFREYYTIQPKKQKKYHKFVKLYFNPTVRKAINAYLEMYPYNSFDELVFASRKGGDAIKESTVWDIFDKAAKKAGIQQNIGSHSLRKTFGYWVWHEAKDKNKALVILMRIFNHADTATTARYIGITDDEFQDTYDSIDLGFDLI